MTDLVCEPQKKEVSNPYKLRKLYQSGDKISPETFYNARQMELYPNLAGRTLYESYIHLPAGRHVFSLSGNFTGNYYIGEADSSFYIFKKNDPEAAENCRISCLRAYHL